MAQTSNTAYGRLFIGRTEELYRRLVEIMETEAANCGDPFTIGLTGGSTPMGFYRWAVPEHAISDVILSQAVWSVSDERMVPLSSEESNFGTADREFLEPIGVPGDRKFPWPVQVDPHSASRAFESRWQERYGASKAFDLCLLGMGEDGHTASIFPNSPLMAIRSGQFFSSVDVPEKGWRLSITPSGLGACGRVVVMVAGERKADPLKAVMESTQGTYPVHLLAACAARTVWLVDEAAGAGIR